MGTYSTAPADAFATVGVTCTDRCRGRSTPVTPAPSQLRMMAPRLPGSVTPSTATRNGGLARRCPSCCVRTPITSPRSASGSSAAWANTPWGASLRAYRSSRALATCRTATRRAAAISTMSATPGSPSSSALIQTSCTLRRSAISSSRTACRPSTCRPPRPFAAPGPPPDDRPPDALPPDAFPPDALLPHVLPTDTLPPDGLPPGDRPEGRLPVGRLADGLPPGLFGFGPRRPGVERRAITTPPQPVDGRAPWRSTRLPLPARWLRAARLGCP